jgi:outer membrane protein assembly factor BamB
VKLIASATALTTAALLGVVCLCAIPVLATPDVTLHILFDLGDGTYVWATEAVVDPAATNATWLAVRSAADANGIPITSTWYASLGIAILDVGDRHPPSGFVGLFEWNATADRWDLASVGISSLVASDGEAIALYNAGFDSHTFEVRRPVPTPDNPIPAIEFRGDLTNSGSSVSSAPRAIQVYWDRNTSAPEIAATPAVALGRVFVTTLHGLFALDERTGGTVWTDPATKGFSSPAAFDDSVIVGTSNGTVVRLNASDGSVRWETRILANPVFSGITSSPKVAFDRVFIGTFNESGGPGEVVSLWASNGTVDWRHPTGSVHYSSPAYANGTVYVGIMGTYNTTSQVSFDPPYGVLALDSETGAERWFFATGGSVAASPAIAADNLIVPAKDGTVYAIRRSSGTEAWRAAVDAGVSSPAVRGDTVFVGGGSFGAGGRVTALDVATGAVRWSFTPNGPVQSSLSYADGEVLFATNTAQGTVYALNASSGAARWTFVTSPAAYALSSPVVADGLVFAASDNGHVVALIGVTVPTGTILGPVLDLGAVLAVVVATVAVVLIVRRRSHRGP